MIVDDTIANGESKSRTLAEAFRREKGVIHLRDALLCDADAIVKYPHDDIPVFLRRLNDNLAALRHCINSIGQYIDKDLLKLSPIAVYEGHCRRILMHAYILHPVFDVVLLDFMMPKMSGIDALPELRRIRPSVKIIMITAFATIENAIDAIKNGASDYIAKPFKIENLLTTIRRVLEEAKFEEGLNKMDLDHTMSSLSNSIRRDIMKLLSVRNRMRLMEITRELGIEDHTKVNFHMKILKESGVIEQDDDKSYSLTTEGKRTMECLKMIENYISK